MPSSSALLLLTVLALACKPSASDSVMPAKQAAGGTSTGKGARAERSASAERAPERCFRIWTLPRARVVGMWAANELDVWAVGETLPAPNHGLIYRWNGRDWTLAYRSETVRFSAVWGSAPHDVWIGGHDGTLVHFDGTAFTERQDSALTERKSGRASPIMTIWGSRQDDVWANGPPHVLLRFGGDGWTRIPVLEDAPPDPRVNHMVYALSGSRENDVWASGSFSNLLHFDGSSWRRLDTGTKLEFRAIWVFAPDDVWIAGGPGWVLRGGKAGFGAVPFPTVASLSHLWGTSPQDVWAGTDRGLFHWDGQRWSSAEGAGGAKLWGVGAKDLWVYQDGKLLQLRPACDPSVNASGVEERPLVLVPVENERRAPDTVAEVPPTEAEARAFVKELTAIVKADDLPQLLAKLSWQQRARTIGEVSLLAWRHALLPLEGRLAGTRFETRREGPRTLISFAAAGKMVLGMHVTREDGELRLDEN